MRLSLEYKEEVKNKGMGEKAKFILKILDRYSFTEKTKKKIKSVINRSIKISHVRNLVAHNPLYLDVFTDGNEEFEFVSNILIA